jgi:cytochrome c-type biogenesis protein CcmH/NrfG
MKKCPLTRVGAFLLLAVALWVAMGNFKAEKTKQQPLHASAAQTKHRLDSAEKKEEPSDDKEFIIKTRVSMVKPNQQ